MTHNAGNDIIIKLAVVAELAYAHDSGSCPLTWVWVQVPSTALLLIIILLPRFIRGIFIFVKFSASIDKSADI